MSDVEPQPASSGGEALYQELLWVHGVIRRDLATVGRLAEDVANGLAPEAVTAEIRSLEANGPLWQLKLNCLHYCRFVHSHHRLENIALFPALRRTNPALSPVVDRLEDDHRRVSDHLDEVEAAARLLETADTAGGRTRLVRSLEALGEHLLAHLELEEESVAETMRSWDGRPG
jgi:hypothetical protein